MVTTQISIYVDGVFSDEASFRDAFHAAVDRILDADPPVVERVHLTSSEHWWHNDPPDADAPARDMTPDEAERIVLRFDLEGVQGIDVLDKRGRVQEECRAFPDGSSYVKRYDPAGRLLWREDKDARGYVSLTRIVPGPPFLLPPREGLYRVRHESAPTRHRHRQSHRRTRAATKGKSPTDDPDPEGRPSTSSRRRP